MASHLGNIRNNEQCRSHHQKMIKTFKGVHQIIEHFRNLYPKEQTTEEGSVQSERKDISMTDLSSDEKVFSYCCQDQESWLEVEQFLNLNESVNFQNCGLFLDEISPWTSYWYYCAFILHILIKTNTSVFAFSKVPQIINSKQYFQIISIFSIKEHRSRLKFLFVKLTGRSIVSVNRSFFVSFTQGFISSKKFIQLLASSESKWSI